MTKSKDNNGISRRHFMTLAGGAGGLVAMASMGVPTGWAANAPEVDTGNMKCQEEETDILVVGGGIAGLFAAVKGHDAGARVMMVSKGRLGASGQTPFARAVHGYDPKKKDLYGHSYPSLDELVDAVSRSALGTNNPVYTRLMMEHSLARVNELREWGFFESPLYVNAFNKPIQERNIPLMERVMIASLIKENGRIAGAAGFSMDEEKLYVIKARTVILCTGAGGFKPNGWPICDLTHDGTIMAYDIGAKVTGKEWNDGHGGRGEHHADCFDDGESTFSNAPTAIDFELQHDLGADQHYIAYKTGNFVTDEEVTGGPYRPDLPEELFNPGRIGGPPGRRRSGVMIGGASAGMAIHKSEGLVPINDKCESNIPGLYAAGDALGSCTVGGIYAQGASAMAGSSVEGAIAAEAAAEYCKGIDMPSISNKKIDEVKEKILAPLKRDSGYGPAWVTQTLQGIMIPNFVLYMKKEPILKAALAYVEELRDHHMPMLRAADMHELRLAHETANMIITAEMKLRASIMRKESRVSHYRLDYPDIDDENWRAWINIYKGSDGSMQLEKQPFDQWPA